MNPPSPDLTEQERERYAWQMIVPGVQEQGQRKLKAATVLISRTGGVGGCVAQQLAAAGVGRLVLVHGGMLRVDDLNRQVLMQTDAIGTSRAECAAERLRAINPGIEVIAVPHHPTAELAQEWAAQADVVVSAAPLFQERHALHDAAEQRAIPCVEAAMYDMEGYVTVCHPPHSPRYRDWCPEKPEWWTRRFPVFGAVSGTIGALAAVETIKLLTGIGDPLYGRMLSFDFRQGRVREVRLPNPQDEKATTPHVVSLARPCRRL
ncbi:HesA/MoeB/ThiF family protein [Luteolibacter arcticus]|uniref:HesA/MoeB/ThiF family protein n=1 Tax=Luteolibacter arcticus TaxID=1581411 RepID=A0ABT3GHA8_9BACT|nr:HesA/MoeB/ThiF family protein [Luteolibacter arcticus]MCW1922653.1 HesA/MoeB/ThiF family protein [Luteolibacter arcticus]